VTAARATRLMTVAGATADILVFSGYAPSFGDDKVEALAETLSAFLEAAGIPVGETADAACLAKVHDRDRALEAVAKADPSIDDGQ
jgi:hypothetical protein